MLMVVISMLLLVKWLMGLRLGDIVQKFNTAW